MRKVGAFFYVGPQAVPFLGFAIEEWLAEDFWVNRLHAEDREWVQITRGEAVENRKSFECEYRMIRADGRVVWVRDMMSVIHTKEAGTVLGGFMLDVTYRRYTRIRFVKAGILSNRSPAPRRSSFTCTT
jgi:PAS domain S-box-containing protein